MTYGSDQYGPPPTKPTIPPQVEAQFRSVDTDKSGRLTADELRRALVNEDWTMFNIETVRMMINMFDTDDDGTIQLHEFAGLWQYIRAWHGCFKEFDKDRSGAIGQRELGNALRTFGYNLPDRLVHLLIFKFSTYGGAEIPLDNFIQVCVTIETLSNAFKSFGGNRQMTNSKITVGYEQFLDLVVHQGR